MKELNTADSPQLEPKESSWEEELFSKAQKEFVSKTVTLNGTVYDEIDWFLVRDFFRKVEAQATKQAKIDLLESMPIEIKDVGKLCEEQIKYVVGGDVSDRKKVFNSCVDRLTGWNNAQNNKAQWRDSQLLDIKEGE